MPCFNFGKSTCDQPRLRTRVNSAYGTIGEVYPRTTMDQRLDKFRKNRAISKATHDDLEHRLSQPDVETVPNRGTQAKDTLLKKALVKMDSVPEEGRRVTSRYMALLLPQTLPTIPDQPLSRSPSTEDDKDTVIDVDGRMESLETLLQHRQKLVDSLGHQLRSTLARLEELEFQMDTVNVMLKTSQQGEEMVREELQEVKDKVEGLENVNDELLESKEKLQVENQVLSGKVEELESKNSNLVQENQDLVKRLQELENQQLIQKSTQPSIIKELESKCTNLSSVNSKLSHQVYEMESRLAHEREEGARQVRDLIMIHESEIGIRTSKVEEEWRDRVQTLTVQLAKKDEELIQLRIQTRKDDSMVDVDLNKPDLAQEVERLKNLLQSKDNQLTKVKKELSIHAARTALQLDTAQKRLVEEKKAASPQSAPGILTNFSGWVSSWMEESYSPLSVDTVY